MKQGFSMMVTENYRVPVRSGYINVVLAKIPLLEVILKFIYWKLNPLIPYNLIILLKKLRYSSIDNCKNDVINLDDLSSFLKAIGIKNGTSLVIHSSYDSLKFMRILPRDVVNMLQSLVGHKGNIMMPANRVFDLNKKPIEYNVARNRIWSGALPNALFLNKESVKSRIPINSAVILGANASSFVADELTESNETPCGINSPWYKLYSMNGLVLGLGVDLVHNLTMTHLVEDTWVEDWPSNNWYDNVEYKLIDGELTRSIVIRQRKEYIGKYFYTEARLAYDLEKNNILKAYNFHGIKVQILNSVELVNYLKKRRDNLYPFYNNLFIR